MDYNQISIPLNKLAVRDHDTMAWCYWYKGVVRCALCKTVITDSFTTFSDKKDTIITEHGIQHLKEHNLLSFI